LPETRQRAFLIERIDIGDNQIDIHIRPTRLAALLNPAAESSAVDDDTQILSVPVELRRSGREIKMRIDATDPFGTAKPDARLIKLLIKARRFNAALVRSDGVPFAALAEREGVSPSYFTRLVRLSYLAPDFIRAILDGRQPRNLTPDKLAGPLTSAACLARSANRARLCLSSISIHSITASSTLAIAAGGLASAAGLTRATDGARLYLSRPERLPLAWRNQRTVLGLAFARSASLSHRHHRRCGTGIWPDRDIAARRRHMTAPRPSLPTALRAPPRTPAANARAAFSGTKCSS
jgi:hypothetical protein